MNSFQELQRLRKDRQESIRISKERSRWQKADAWLSRLNHLAQIGILVAAVVGYFYTIVPLYEKAALDEALAKAQLELNSTQKKINESYLQLRHYVVQQFIFNAGAECTGLLIPLDANSRQRGGLDIAVGECLRNGFRANDGLRALSKVDYAHLDEEIEGVAAEIDSMRRKAINEYENLSSRAKSDPSILPKPIKRHLLMLEVRKRMGYSEEEVQSDRYEMMLHAAQLEVTGKYGVQARDLIKQLNELVWPVAGP